MAIFISYSHKDKKFVDRLCANLITKKIHLWLDRWELKPGDSLIDSIQTALEHAGAILIVLSKNYIESTWCKKEMNSGLIRELEGKGNIIIPVVTDDCDIPIFLREKMYADFRGDWDEAYRMLSETLSKYSNLDQGRFDNPEFHVDYSSEYVSKNDQIIGLRYQFSEHAENRPFSILSILHIFFDEKWQRRYMEYVRIGNEDVARRVITLILLSFLEKNEIKISLSDASVVHHQVEVYDERKDLVAILDLEVRWMGEDTGKTIIYWAGESIKGALNQFIQKIRPFSPEEVTEIDKISRRSVT